MLRRVAALLLVLATPAQAEIIIGVAGPFSGQYQTFGTSLLNGVKAAADKINAEGGLNKEPLSIISADDQCDTVKAREAAQKLLSQQADVVIGHPCSNAALEAAKIYDQAGITLIAPSATLPGLTEAGLGTVIRIAARMDTQGAFAARRILAKRPNAKLALIDDGTAEMKAISASFTASYGKPPTLTASITPEQKDFTDLVGKMKAAGVDTLYLATQAADAGRISTQAAKAGMDVKRYGPDALLAEGFWALSGAAGESTLASFPVDPESYNEAKALAKDMKVLGQATDGPFLPAYAALQLFAEAATRTGPHAHAGIATALKSGGAFQTVLGPLRFDAKGDSQDLRFNWYSWNNGVYQTIAPENP